MNYSDDSRILLSSQREGQVSRFRFWVMLAIPLAAILFQVYVPLFFQFLGYLEMPLLVVVYFALMRRSQVSGLMVGALVGLVSMSTTFCSALSWLSSSSSSTSSFIGSWLAVC